MDTFQQFLARLAAGTDGSDAPPLSEEEWEGLRAAAEGATSEKQAISQVLLEAYRLRRRPIPDAGPVVDVALPPSRPDAGSPTSLHQLINGADVDLDAPTLPTGAVGPDEDLLAIPADFAASPPTRATNSDVQDVAAGLDTEAVGVGAAVGVLASERPRVSPVDLEPEPEAVHDDRAPRRRPHTKSKRIVLDERRRERWLSVASWVRNIGAILILFAAWQLWGTAIAQHQSQAALKGQFDTKVHAAAKPAAGFTLAPTTANIPDPPQGTVMALLQIPKISLNEYVVSGTAANDLALGPGHYLHTAQPGQAGNVAIAGHRTTHGAPFNRLAELATGDPIYLTTLSGQRLTYIVAATPFPVSPSNVSVLNNFGDNRLTLTTCNPEYSAVQRLIVVAGYEPPGATKPPPIAKGTGTPYKLAPTATSGWDTGLIPLVALELGLVLALGFTNRRLARTYGREGRWLILVPIWIALMLALFQTLTDFLPAAV